MKKIISFVIITALIFSLITPSSVFAVENLPNFIDMAYGNGTYVAIDDKAGIAVSRDCINWYYVIYKNTTYGFDQIIWGNNEFMVLAGDPSSSGETTLLRSKDGLKWDAIADEATKSCIYSVSFVNGKYMAVGYEKLITSEDGITWTKQNINDSSYLQSSYYDGKQYIAVGGYCGSGRIMASIDGVNWPQWYELMDNCGDDLFWKIFYTGKYYVILTIMGGIFYTKDLADGHRVIVNKEDAWMDFCGLAYDGNVFVGASWEGVYFTKDGENWVKCKIDDLGDYKLRTIKYLNGKFYILAGSDKTKLLITSQDGSSWQTKKLTNIYTDTSSIPSDFSTRTVNTNTAGSTNGNVITDLKGVLNEKSINLSWNTSTSATDIIGYYIYRRTASTEYSQEPITDFPIESTSYLDDDISLGTTYYYKCCAVYSDGSLSPLSSEAKVLTTKKVITLKIGSPYMTVNGVNKLIDNNYTTPKTINGRTYLPFKALIEELGGTYSYTIKDKKITLTLNGNIVVMWIDKKNALVNNVPKVMDVPPKTILGKAMIPFKFACDNLGCTTTLDAVKKQMTIS